MGKKVVKSPGKLKAKFPLINRKKDGWFLPNATRTLSQIKPSFFGSGGVESGGFGQKSRPPPAAAVINLMGKEIMRVSLAQETMLMLMMSCKHRLGHKDMTL